MTTIITLPMFGDLTLNIPRYFTIFGFQIYYYALCIVLGFGLAAVYIIKRKDLFSLTTDNVLDMLLVAVPCGIIGARIYYMLFNFDHYFAPGQWGNIIRFRDGGLAVYGGIILSVIGVVIYARVKKIQLGNILDAGGFGLFIGQAIGRWGNFINGEAYGVETTLPWRMGISDGVTVTYHHPAFLYESLWNLGGFLIIHLFSKSFKTKYPGQYFLFYVAWYGVGRFMIESLRTDSLYIWGTGLRVSQWLAFATFVIALGMLLYLQYFKKDEALADGETPAGSDDTSEINEAEELAKLDGADKEDVDYEADSGSDDDDADEEDVSGLAELDGADASDVETETAPDTDSAETNDKKEDGSNKGEEQENG